MTYCNAPRFPEPYYAKTEPKRQGCFILEEAWLGFENGNYRFFAKPDLAPVMVQLQYQYTVEDGEEPFIRSILWRSPGEIAWEVIPCSHQGVHLFAAAEDLLKGKEIAAQFERWVDEHSEPVPPADISVFLREIRMAAE